AKKDHPFGLSIVIVNASQTKSECIHSQTFDRSTGARSASTHVCRHATQVAARPGPSTVNSSSIAADAIVMSHGKFPPGLVSGPTGVGGGRHRTNSRGASFEFHVSARGLCRRSSGARVLESSASSEYVDKHTGNSRTASTPGSLP